VEMITETIMKAVGVFGNGQVYDIEKGTAVVPRIGKQQKSCTAELSS